MHTPGHFDILDDLGQAYSLRIPMAERGLYDSTPADRGGPLANTRIASINDTMQRHDRKTAGRFTRLREELGTTPEPTPVASPIGIAPDALGPHVVVTTSWWDRLRGRA